MGQQCRSRIKEKWQSFTESGSQFAANNALVAFDEAVNMECRRAFDRAANFNPNVKRGELLSQFYVEAMIVAAIGGSAELFLCNPQTTGTQASFNGLRYFVWGTGEGVARHFLAFLRRVFWGEESLSIDRAVLSVIWTLAHMIESGTEGVGRPINLAVMSHSEGQIKAAAVTEAQLASDIVSIENIESFIADYPPDE